MAGQPAMPISYIVAVLLALFVWKVPGAVVAAASVNGLVVAGTLLYIIFGAILLLNTLQESGGLKTIPAGVYRYFPGPADPGDYHCLAVRGVY